MQGQRPVYVPSSFSLSTKKRSPGQTATQLSAVEEGEIVSISQFWTLHGCIRYIHLCTEACCQAGIGLQA